MARRVFFSFHYERDIIRANVVRNCWVINDSAGFWDASLWEEAKKTSNDAIKRLIMNGLQNTSVTAVLIGTQTANRDWVKFEIDESHNRGNGLLGIYIHNIPDFFRRIETKGENPFNFVWTYNFDGSKKFFSEIYPTYDWINNDGYHNFSSWVEFAAQKAGK